MDRQTAVSMLCDREFLDKLYAFSYKRCSSSQEAEDLCQDILLAVLRALSKNDITSSFYAFVWTVAGRVYADHCDKRKKQTNAITNTEYFETADVMEDPIDALAESEAEKEMYGRVLREISFLSKMYRDVMIMYYLDDVKTSEIARELGISETAVKQRLFSARKTLKKEVEKMDNRSLTLKPKYLDFFGTGNPNENDPAEKAERVLSQNIVYLCKNEAKTAKELSEALSVPMMYVEEELEILTNGLNGSYGLLRKLDNGKYISNILAIDEDEAEEAMAAYKKHLPEICEILGNAVVRNREKILNFPFLSKQDDLRFILWSMISHFGHTFEWLVGGFIEKEHFSDTEAAERPYTTVAHATDERGKAGSKMYGQDGIGEHNIWGYRHISAWNTYGKRISKAFSCNHNMVSDGNFYMTVRAIGGLDIASLSEEEKEGAAKAVSIGFLRKTGERVEPNVIVINREDEDKFNDLLADANAELETVAAKVAADVAAVMKKRIPKHLMCEWKKYNALVAGANFIHDLVEECIRTELLYIPEEHLGESVVISVKK